MYLDANFFVIARQWIDEKGAHARGILRQIANGRRAVTSVLALDEVMWVFRKQDQNDKVRQVIEDIYATPNLEVKEAPSLVPLRALDFMERHKLKPRDAFHLAIMEHFNEREIVTDDKDFDKIPGVKRIRI